MVDKFRAWGAILVRMIRVWSAARTKHEEDISVNSAPESESQVFSPAAPSTALEQLIAQITPENRHDEVDFGPPTGRETW